MQDVRWEKKFIFLTPTMFHLQHLELLRILLSTLFHRNTVSLGNAERSKKRQA